MTGSDQSIIGDQATQAKISSRSEETEGRPKQGSRQDCVCVWIIARSGLARGTSLVVRARCQIAAGSMQHACCKATSGPLVLQQANPLSFICTSFQRPQPKLSPPSPLPIKMSAPPLAQSYRVLKAVRKPLQRVLPLPPHQSEIRAPSEFPIVHPTFRLRFEDLGRIHRHYRLLNVENFKIRPRGGT